METRRRLTDAEGRMLDRLHQTLTVQQALALTHAIAQLSREFVSADRLAEFARRLRMIAAEASLGPKSEDR